jgi:hypothetical protein
MHAAVRLPERSSKQATCARCLRRLDLIDDVDRGHLYVVRHTATGPESVHLADVGAGSGAGRPARRVPTQSRTTRVLLAHPAGVRAVSRQVALGVRPPGAANRSA